MEQFSSKRKTPFNPRVLFVVLLVCALGACGLYGREGENGILHKIQGGASVVSAPFQYAGTLLGSAFADATENVDNALASSATLSELQEENAQLRAQVAELEEYKQEAQRLEQLLEIDTTYRINGVSARVVGRSTEAYNQTITIDVGESSGVDSGQTDMGPNGVIGQVISTTSNTATVRLLTDPSSGVAVLIQSNRSEGIVEGSLEGLLYLDCIDESVTVQIGDVVVTSGLGGSYTRGLIVGTVIRVDEKQGESERVIVVSPNENAGPLQEVTVVLGLGSSQSTSTGDEQ